MKGLGGLVGGAGRLGDRLSQFEHLAGGLEVVEGGANIGRQINRRRSDARFGCVQAVGGDLQARRAEQKVDKAHHQRPFDIGPHRGPVGESRRYIEHRVSKQAGLGDIGLRDAHVLDRCLESGVVDQGDANGRIGGELLLEQAVNGGTNLRGGRIAIVPVDVGVDAAGDSHANVGERRLLRWCGATATGEARRHDGRDDAHCAGGK